MTWFTENPTPPVVLGTLIASIAAFLLIKTGSRAALWALIGTVVATIAAVVANVLIMTPREQVTAALDEIRAQVEANDPTKLLTYIDPAPTPPAIRARNQVQYDLANLTVKSAKINDLKVVVSDSGNTAKAEFIGVVDFENAGGRLPFTHFVLRFRVDLKRIDGRWLVAGYETSDPLGKTGGGETAVPQGPRSIDDGLAAGRNRPVANLRRAGV